MFAKKKKKTVSENAVEKSARFYCILQLCVVFTVLCWHAGYPFLGEIYDIKQEKRLYDFIFDPVNRPFKEELPQIERVELEKGQRFWQTQLDKTFVDKLKGSFWHMYRVMPRLELIWAVLSVVICVMALKQKEGYRHVVWLLPMITLLFVVENIAWGQIAPEQPDEKLYPSEEVLVERYLPNGLATGIEEQQSQLKEAWESYLTEDWGKGNLGRGEFLFIQARIEARKEAYFSLTSKPMEKQPYFWLALYLLWNTLLAWKVSARATDTSNVLEQGT